MENIKKKARKHILKKASNCTIFLQMKINSFIFQSIYLFITYFKTSYNLHFNKIIKMKIKYFIAFLMNYINVADDNTEKFDCGLHSWRASIY